MIAFVRWTVLGVLLALRLPSLVHPVAADQNLYAYIGLRILAGEAPYVDAWDQKPPGIHVLYALLWAIWPDERIVNIADLAAAIGVSSLLIVFGRRVATPWAGWIAAWIFALLANPSMHRLSGIFQRGQCETFIALAVTGALVLAVTRRHRPAAMIGAGVLMGAAIWLKYNAVVFALPLVAAIWLWQPGTADRRRSTMVDGAWVVGSAAAVGVVGLVWLAWHGALTDLWLATFAYNVDYSSSGYSGPGAFLWYLVTMPLRQARHELLWMVGLAGAGLGLCLSSSRRAAVVAGAWITAAVLAIALNGRDLPQYFVQATPALAFAAGAGLTGAWTARTALWRVVVVALVVVGFWRVGTDHYVLGVARLAGLPGLVDNVGFDLAYLRGTVDRRTYLDRFGGQRSRDKFSALDVDELAGLVAANSTPGDRVLVFGFSPGALVKAQRESASRFFWSLPVILEFAADRPGYGTAGLLADLQRTQPALVVLQRRDWEPPLDSHTYFLAHPALSAWLQSGYQQIADTGRYVVWQRGRDASPNFFAKFSSTVWTTRLQLRRPVG